MLQRLLMPAVVLGAVLATSSHAADWDQFRGPRRDNISLEKDLLSRWPQEGPPLIWKASGLGGGYSSVSLAGDRLYTLGNKGNTSQLHALDRASGKILWSSAVGPAGGNLGCTPTVDGDRIYALGQRGDLVCVAAETGKRLWHRNVQDDFGGVCGGWKYCESPLVEGDRVVVTPGGKDATMVALDKKTGETIWKCAIPVEHTEAGYSSIVIAKVGDIRHYVQLLNGGVVGVGEDGRFLWKYEKLGPNTANIPTPVVLDDHIFACAGYGKGGALLRMTAEGRDVNVEEVYFNQRLTNKHGGVVCVNGRVFGDEDDHGRPFCADVKTGKVLWTKERGDGKGEKSASVTYADGHLYFFYENGVVALVDASAESYKEVGWFRLPRTSGPCWAHPVVVEGKLYLREGDFLYCYDVRNKS